MSSLGDSGLSVFQAGHWSWQRPHSVQVVASSSIFQLASLSVPTPNCESSSTFSKVNGFPSEIIGGSDPKALLPLALRPKKMLKKARNRCHATPQLRLCATTTSHTIPTSSLNNAKLLTNIGLAGNSVATCRLAKSAHADACP